MTNNQSIKKKKTIVKFIDDKKTIKAHSLVAKAMWECDVWHMSHRQDIKPVTTWRTSYNCPNIPPYK